MKKLIILCLSLSLLLATFLGCNNTKRPLTNEEDTNFQYSIDVWDGSIDSSFAGGDGTQADPYQISTSSQFAYLAQQVNSGILYSGNYFVLCNDIDLNNIEWTPIGNGINAFMGNFDGKEHTIKNLNISESMHYTYEYPTGKKVPYCSSGLFATIQDASIQNIIIDGADVKITDTKNGDTHYVGVLCGNVRTYQGASTISNVKIKNATITADFPTNQGPYSLSIGGVIGYIYAYNNTTTTISLIETDSSLSLSASFSPRNYIGTVLGVVNLIEATFTLENCAAYQMLIPNPYQYYYGASSDFCGAIGKAQASAQPFTVKNIFSKLCINKPAFENSKYFDAEIVTNTVIGESYYFALKDDPDAVGYNFENVFGCVEHMDTETGEKTIYTELYNLPDGPSFAQTNCEGCEALPESHGFDTTVWDLSDLTKPKLKKQ